MVPILGIMASQISGHLTPPSSFESIATLTVGSGGTASISFSSIPATFTHLQVRAIHQTNRATYNVSALYFQFNGDTATNYSNHQLDSIPNSPGTTAVSGAASNATNISGLSTTSSIATNMFGASVTDILDYANTNKYKTSRTLSGSETNGAVSSYAGYVDFSSGSWRSTSAITSITFYPFYGTLLSQYSTFALYGVK